MISNPDIKFLKSLNTRLNGYTYGLYEGNSNIKIENPTPNDYYMHQRIADPSIFERRRGGTCWDYVTYQALMLQNHAQFTATSWFMLIDDGKDMPSHTFMTVTSKYSSTPYYFESAFKRIMGLYEIFNLADALLKVYDTTLDISDTDLSRYPCSFYMYNATDPTIINMSCKDFYAYIGKHYIGEPYHIAEVYARGRTSRLTKV